MYLNYTFFVIVTFILSLFSISVRRRIRTCIGCKTHVQAAVDTYLKITLFSFPLSSKKVDLMRQKPSWGTNWSYYVKTGLVDGQVLITNWQINVMLTQSRFINNCVKTGSVCLNFWPSYELFFRENLFSFMFLNQKFQFYSRTWLKNHKKAYSISKPNPPFMWNQQSSDRNNI